MRTRWILIPAVLISAAAGFALWGKIQQPPAKEKAATIPAPPGSIGQEDRGKTSTKTTAKAHQKVKAVKQPALNDRPILKRPTPKPRPDPTEQSVKKGPFPQLPRLRSALESSIKTSKKQRKHDSPPQMKAPDIARKTKQRTRRTVVESAKSHFIKAVEFQKAGKVDLAIAQYKQAIAVDPSMVAAYNNLGNIYLMDKNDPDEAIRLYLKALELDPSYYKTHNNLGSLYVKKGYPELAMIEYQKAISLNPGSELAYYNLACLYTRQGEREKALKLLKKSISLNPESASWAKIDPDFKPIRNDPAFKALLEFTQTRS